MLLPELLKTTKPTKHGFFTLQEILGTRTNEDTGIAETLVSYLFYSSDFDEWIPSANLSNEKQKLY